jgi:hypothetical protein
VKWLDHSEEDQRRVREMLQLFSDKGTVDDLGIGTVRDTISNALFPGTSIIQTRARYFLFIAWIFQRAERDHPQRLVDKAGDMERNLIEALRSGEDLDGLIGRDAGKNVQTLPSVIFWGGIVRYGIFQFRSLSIRQYGRHVAHGQSTTDAEGELGDRAVSFWRRDIPAPPDDFFKFRTATFELNGDESEWLCERIISSDQPDREASMLAMCVRDLRLGHGPLAANAIWDATLPADTPERARELVSHAQRFSAAAHGASLLYNLILAEERSKTTESTDSTAIATYASLLDEWADTTTQLGLKEWAAAPSEFWNCLLNFARVPQATRNFIDEWSKVLASDPAGVASSTRARDLIWARELHHKRGQARLANKKRLVEWSGYAGTTPLAYRWPQVQRMLRDIAAGLSASPREAEDAVA